MNTEDARYLKRKITAGSIDVHPTEKALIVNYEVEAVILSETGEPVLGDKKQCQKVIKVGPIGENSDISLMARQIIDKCKLIHNSKQPEIEQLLFYLKNRKESNSAPNSAGKQKTIKSTQSNLLQNLSFGNLQIKETANINDVEMYLEMLYDDIPERLRGTNLILQLSMKPENLEELCQNEILLGALSRVLSEDWKNNTELATNIIHIFFCFSRFSQLHTVVSHFQTGSLCMKIIEHELSTYDGWISQLKKIVKKESLKTAQKQLQQLASKQEQLLRVSFHMLLNLAEDRRVEAKMHKKGIVKMLVKTLDRKNNVDLLILVISFLKKLSIFVENKDHMVKLDTVEKLATILNGSNNEELTNISLRLLLNLSFDTNLRKQMMQHNLFKTLMDLLKSETNRSVALCVLYNLSVDRDSRLKFAESDCCQQLVKLLMVDKDKAKVPIEILGLCINLATNSECADLMTDSKVIQILLKKALKNRDGLIAKLLKKLSSHVFSPPKNDHNKTDNDKKTTQAKKVFLDYVGEFGENVKNALRDEFSAECLGILANLKDPELDFEMILKEYKLFDWLKENLKPASLYSSDDDVIFEMVRLINTSCLDESCASKFSEIGLVQLLISLLNIKQEEDDVVVQIVHIFYQLVRHQSTRDNVVMKTQAPAYLIDLMHDGNEQIRKICSTALELVAKHDEIWSKKIKLEKFRTHNMQWIEMIKMQQQQQQQQLQQDQMIAAPDDYFLYAHHKPNSGKSGPTFGADGLKHFHDSFLGGFIEDVSALDSAEFNYGDGNLNYMRGDNLSLSPSDLYGSLKKSLKGQNIPFDPSDYDFQSSGRSPSFLLKEPGRSRMAPSFGMGDDNYDDHSFGSSYYLEAMGYVNGGR